MIIFHVQAIGIPIIGLILSIFSVDSFRLVFEDADKSKNMAVNHNGKAVESAVRMLGNILLLAYAIFTVLQSILRCFNLDQESLRIESLLYDCVLSVFSLLISLLILIPTKTLYERYKSTWYCKKDDSL